MNLRIHHLRKSYREGTRTPVDVIAELIPELAASDSRIWIQRVPDEQLLEIARSLKGKEDLPLYGIPFAIKDNIDLAGVPTTAACPGYSYVPEKSASVVERLIEAGAIPLGKTNLDQFATGLVGVRSPHGTPANPFDEDFVPGGSSSGSAVAVARGLASFALGTDTAGSGRVPAAFNNLFGLKPTIGRLSTAGVVPACRSLDCVSVFAHSAAEAQSVLSVAAESSGGSAYQPSGKVLGVPPSDQLEFFGDAESEGLFFGVVERLQSLGWQLKETDFTPFLEAAKLLYDAPWVAERYAAVGDFIAANPEAVHPVTKRIIEAGGNLSAADVFRG
ncbi:MAG: amidase family protein, partial [Verrucomicrobiota bacterium]